MLKEENKVKLLQGNNLDLIKELEDNSIDVILTDPPYGLKFMNKKWDYDVPSVEFWKEVYRVLKPGGHILSFGGTRTYHRMVVNCEDAGFEVRDCISWLYGCVDEETEAFTNNGWKKYSEITKDDLFLTWNSSTDTLHFQEATKINIKPFYSYMYSLKNKHTDQLVTPNHRVYAKYTRKDRNYDGINYEVVEACDMKKSGSYDLPLASYYEGEGIGGENYASLLGWIWSEGTYNINDGTISISQSSVNEPYVTDIDNLLNDMEIKYSKYDRKRSYEYKYKGKQEYNCYMWYFSTTNDINDKIKEDLPNKKLTYDLVFKMSIKEKEAFLLSAEKGDGSKNRCVIYQQDKEQLDILQMMYATIGKSAHFNYNKISVNYRNKQTTQLQNRHLKNNKVFYDGIVWCPTVDNGAFVARRNKKVFITGNSGFPKSHNIGKAVDKLEGNERKVIGELKNYQDKSCKGGVNSHMMEEVKPRIDIEITKGTSKFEGWGTALKPAVENVLLATKEGEVNYELEDYVDFLYTAKVSKKERNIGCEDLEPTIDNSIGNTYAGNQTTSKIGGNPDKPTIKQSNGHPTVKPIKLMKYLCKLVTPPNGVILDPFMGSGSTGISALLEGFNFIGMEQSPEYFKIAEARINNWEAYKKIIKD